MRHFLRRMPAGNAVAAGGTVTFQLPLGPTYRSWELRPTIAGVDATEAQMRAQITNIRAKVNGISRIDVTATRWLDLFEYYGFTVDDGVLPLLFSRPNARTLEGEENSAIGTRNVQSLSLEVDLDGAATIDGLVLDAMITPESRDLGPMIEVHTNTFTAGAAGTFEISTLPRGRGDLVALHMFSANLDEFELKVDGVDYFDGDRASWENIVKRTGRVPVANVFHYEPTFLDRYNDAIPLTGVQDFRVVLEMSAGGAVPIVMESLNVPIRPTGAGAA